VICLGCGAENPPDKRFCGDCGAPLATGCPSCGATNPPGKRFCGDCGTTLAASAAPATAGPDRSPAHVVVPAVAAGTAPIAERRLVSVLFADLVGFTTLAEGRDAEDTRELLSRYFELSREVIGRYGGTVEKFIGDAVMAIWGAPVAHEDDAERAVRAGLDLVDAVRTLGPGIAARAGVLTGEAAVTIGATNQGMVAGDIVNTASRLQSAAAPGTVLVGEATERAASRAIAFEPVGEQALKGKALPVAAWRAVRVVAQVGGRNRSDVLEAPFVGRDDELRLIKDLFHATTRERRARLVSVIGPAGIGKTRLAWEFRKYEDGLVETVWFHDGRSPAYGEGISFWALGEMIRRRAGLVETDDEATTRTKVAATVAEHVSAETERRWIEPALLALLGIDAGSVPADELFAAWRAFFERMAATAPVVLVFEDFHYADSGLIDFVDHLLEWSRSFPIYIVTLARPELIERRPDWGAGKRSFTSIFLEPLAPEMMKLLLRGLIPGLPDSAEAAIVARADGIPLYAVETVRMLVSEGRLVVDDGVYRPVGDLTNLAVPETLTALIASRLDALPMDERALVSDAAVLGQSFTTPGLESMSGLDAVTVAARLHSLVRKEILRVETDPRSPERGQYVFVQALIREVAYNALAKRDRKTRHLAAARFFESLDTEEIAGGLAGHYLAAYQNSAEGPEADAVAAQARIALTAAAQRAIELGSYEQALTFFEQALTVTTDRAETARLLERAGETASLAGRHEAAESFLRRALAAQRELGDRVAAAGVTAALGRMLNSAYRIPDAIALLEPAATEFADLASAAEGIGLMSQLARAYFLIDNNRAAIDLADRILDRAEHDDLRALIADTLVTKGTALGVLGRPVEGLGVVQAGRQLAEANGLGSTVLRAMNNLAFLDAGRDPRAAFAMSQAGLALARRLGMRRDIPNAIGGLGEFGLRTGDWEPALTELEAALAEDWETVDRVALLISAIPLRALRGEPVEAALVELDRLAREHDDLQQLAFTAITFGLASFAAGKLGEAREFFRRSTTYFPGLLDIARSREARAALWAGEADAARDDLAALVASAMHGPAIDTNRVTVRAGIAALEGRTRDALSLYREALRSWRDLGLAWDEALCGLDMALLLDVTDPEVAAAAQASREILVRLGAKPFLERLDAALARGGGNAGHPVSERSAAGRAAPADPQAVDRS
jgi:class 3 adenylate cyclase/tetratricopeptide (TPR) repeat protein